MDLSLLYFLHCVCFSELFGDEIFSHLRRWEGLVHEFVFVAVKPGMVFEMVFLASQELVYLF